MLLLFFGCSLTFMWLFHWDSVSIFLLGFLRSCLGFFHFPFCLAVMKTMSFIIALMKNSSKQFYLLFLQFIQFQHCITLLLLMGCEKLIISRVFCYYFIKNDSVFLPARPWEIKLFLFFNFHSYFMNFVSVYFFICF